MENQSVNQRIAAIIEEEKITPNAFANKLDVKATIIYNLLNDRNKPGYNLLLKICEVFRVNGNWLLTGAKPVYSTINTFDEVEYIKSLNNEGNEAGSNSKVGTDYKNDIGADEINRDLTRLVNSNILHLEFHLIDIHLNLKLLQENLTGKKFDRREYEQSHQSIMEAINILKASLKTGYLTNQSLIDGLFTMDEAGGLYLDNIRSIVKDLYLNHPKQ